MKPLMEINIIQQFRWQPNSFKAHGASSAGGACQCVNTAILKHILVRRMPSAMCLVPWSCKNKSRFVFKGTPGAATVQRGSRRRRTSGEESNGYRCRKRLERRGS
ncbi:uncharacterized protein BT62DRAFT_935505 [Guyanagaster necrorhizus]|uniref:Uncharacterized protein n=1 Tax=Guyanagaster necrorhizus TaxID=856835 RepID=A0A9P7VNK0_9AGAR|nr:uncharacterized protein BT62DRAFT_935505 [Guyanagaster necrorhizus MCA 3950]KAG7443171.1 hypothetical protein BT62DRAFT_935505 [Guyanagaster necrorhizus MCA 3950]